jgi:pSer/pThr/pTyr-binding forkhead associated (FHA) protein
VEIKSEVFTIGRLPDNDLCIADQRLSGRHCRIMRKMNEEGKMIVVLEDSSSNGTYFNGTMVSHISL